MPVANTAEGEDEWISARFCSWDRRPALKRRGPRRCARWASGWTNRTRCPAARDSEYHAVIVRARHDRDLPMLAARLRAKRHFGRRVLLALVAGRDGRPRQAGGGAVGIRFHPAEHLRRPRSRRDHPPPAASVPRVSLPASPARPPPPGGLSHGTTTDRTRQLISRRWTPCNRVAELTRGCRRASGSPRGDRDRAAW